MITVEEDLASSPIPFQRLAGLLTHNDGGVWGDDPVGDLGTTVLRSTEITAGGRWRNLEEAAVRTIEPRDRIRARLATGDIVVTKASGSPDHIGKAALVDATVESMNACYGNFMQRLRTNPRVLLPEFLHFFLMSEIARSQFHLLGTTSTGLMNLSGGLLNDIVIPLPPLAEQARIACFLDDQTTRIDGIVAARSRQLELLEEEQRVMSIDAVCGRQQVVRSARDTQVPWLGAIPSHWQMTRARFVCDIKTGSGDTVDADPEGAYPFYVRSQTPLASSTFEFDGPAVLTAGDGAGVGKVFHLVDGRFMAHQRVYVLNRFRQIHPAYFFHVFSSTFAQSALDGSAKSTVDSVRRHMIADLPVPLPPLDEQGILVRQAEDAISASSTAGVGLRQSIDLLQEFKQALISAAVSGAFDVAAASGRGVPA